MILAYCALLANLKKSRRVLHIVFQANLTISSNVVPEKLMEAKKEMVAMGP